MEITQHTRLLLSQPIYAQRHGEMWAVCHTGPHARRGRVLLLSLSSMWLLSLLREAKSHGELLEAARRQHQWKEKDVGNAINDLLAGGIIHHPDMVPIEQKSTRLEVWFHITDDCNLDCPGCYIQKSRQKMSMGTARLAIDSLCQTAKSHNYKEIFLKYAGGEPTLAFSHLRLTHEYALEATQRYGLKITGGIISNGVSISQPMIAYIKKRQLGLSISIDGPAARPYRIVPYTKGDRSPSLQFNTSGGDSFSAVTKNIKRILKHQIIPLILITVSPFNIDELPKLMEFITESKLRFHLSLFRPNRATIDPRLNPERLSKETDRLIVGLKAAYSVIEKGYPQYPHGVLDTLDFVRPRYHKHTCGVGRDYVVVNHLGQVSRCQVDMNNPVGSIYQDDDLIEMIRKSPRSPLQGPAIDEKTECDPCVWRFWCTGGCPKLSLTVLGRCDRKSPNCEIYEELLPELVRIEANRILYLTSS